MSLSPPPRVTIVTGAAGGVGRAVVRLLESRGECVVAEDLDESVEELASDSVATLRADVSEEATAADSVDLALERFGRLDGLVNNAGRFLAAPIQGTSADDWDRILRTNVRGAFLHTRAARDPLVAHVGAVVNVASISGLIGIPDQVAYAASKGALVQLTRASAIELAPTGVRVNAVAPGAISTPFMDEALEGAPDIDAVRQEIAKQHPLGRMSSADEVAATVGFLLSSAASAITGAILPVDGGFTAR